MAMAQGDATGMALGAWGTVQAAAAGLAIASGGLLSDTVASLAKAGLLGPALVGPATGYTAVYLTEVGLLFATPGRHRPPGRENRGARLRPLRSP